MGVSERERETVFFCRRITKRKRKMAISTTSWRLLGLCLMMTVISIHAAVPALLSSSNNVSCSSVRSAYRARGLPDRDVPQSQLPISGNFFFLLSFFLNISKDWPLKTRGERKKKYSGPCVLLTALLCVLQKCFGVV